MKKKKKKKTTTTSLSAPVLIERRFRVLSDAQVEHVYTMWMTAHWTQREIADELGVSTHTIGVCCRSTPAHLFRNTKQSKALATLREQRRKIRGGKDHQPDSLSPTTRRTRR